MPITTTLLKTMILDQLDEMQIPPNYHQRTSEKKLLDFATNKEIVVITGVRRCGKSVLLHHCRQQSTERDYYFNFEDERLAMFTSEHFQMLYEVMLELYGEQHTFYFDEIQNIPGWETFIRRLYNAGNKIFITGSNATLFSEELGSRLTGRYIPLRVYPFSFYEFASYEHSDLLRKTSLSTKESAAMKKLFSEYSQYGGIPVYVKDKQIDYLHSLYESIIYRDIVSRYNINNVSALKQLVFYLASNCGKETTFNSLKKMLGLGSATTVSDYCGYLENSYLCFFVNRYSPSIKSQQQSPKKVYFIDHALAKLVGFRFSEDLGRLLENIAFIELKRRGGTIFYHRENKECDFIIQEGTKITMAIQVCQTLSNTATKQREIAGLLEAMQCFSLSSGIILTENEEGQEKMKVDKHSYKISILPIWKWLKQ